MEEYISAKKLRESGCCVPGCRNYGKKVEGVHFYSFSNVSYKKPQTEKWIKAIRRIKYVIIIVYNLKLSLIFLFI